MMESMSRSDSFFMTDLDDDREREDMARQALAVLGDLLDGASLGLEELQRNDMLGSAIVRKCQELADAIGGLAKQLTSQTEEERRALAQACLQDARHCESSLFQMQQQQQQQQRLSYYGSQYDYQYQEQQLLSSQLSSISEDDMMEALSGAQSILVDVEAALRSIDQDEADEIADVAITVARLFVASCKSAYSTLTPQKLAGTAVPTSDRVVLLNNDGSTAVVENSTTTPTPKGDRLRVLWPPLGPAVGSALQWSKDQAMQQPLLAVALGLALWPAAIITSIVTTPMILADGLVQSAYNSLQDGPIVSTLERGAAQAYHASRLALLCSGLVCRQSLRVANRQLDRHGGPQKVLQTLGEMAAYRATHPVETACMTWNGISWGFNVLKDAAITLHQAASREMEKEMDKTTQSCLQ